MKSRRTKWREMSTPYNKLGSLKEGDTWRSRCRWEWNNGINFDEVGIGVWAVLQWLRLGEHGTWQTLVELWVPLKVWKFCYLSYCYLPQTHLELVFCFLPNIIFDLSLTVILCHPKLFNETCEVGRRLLSVGTLTVGGILRHHIDIERTNSC